MTPPPMLDKPDRPVSLDGVLPGVGPSWSEQERALLAGDASGLAGGAGSGDAGDSGGVSDGLGDPGLTDFVDLATLQEIQDSFSSVTRLATSIVDASGARVTAPTDAERRAESDALLERLMDADTAERDGDRITAPIVVQDRVLGSIVVERGVIGPDDALSDEARAKLAESAARLGVSGAEAAAWLEAAEQAFAPKAAASVQLLYLMANAIARLCYEQHAATQRLRELSALYRVSTVLSAHHDLQEILETAARASAEVMRAPSSAIRMLRGQGPERRFELAAAHNLSAEFVAHATAPLEDAGLLREALSNGVSWSDDMADDARVPGRAEAQRAGLRSVLVAGVVYRGRPIGTLEWMTDTPRSFSPFERRLARAVGQLLASAIENARLAQAQRKSEGVTRQVRLAADVQRRMMPAAPPALPGFEVAARYVPSQELSGDFYDFIELDGGSVGLAMGDVVGKGVAASLLMASVRASLRAFAQDVYDLDEVLERVNIAMCRDTRDHEFATVFYGTLSPETGRLTYSNAGHEPPIWAKADGLVALEVGGMIVGIDGDQGYDKSIVDLSPGDLLVLFTDGLDDAMNALGKRFGRKRIERVVEEARRDGCSAADVVGRLFWQMRNYAGSAPATDDTTLVVVKRLG
ncbi:MAG: SpoIIE family protein phosphatase [Planctomycetota bacterium]